MTKEHQKKKKKNWNLKNSPFAHLVIYAMIDWKQKQKQSEAQGHFDEGLSLFEILNKLIKACKIETEIVFIVNTEYCRWATYY